ncbi:MAG: hypothetical protein R3325_07930 [Thermoanaerobaculia bacterium]|nr:hypothetical protein [Thermoanaerobaculia bacterium]
MPGRSARALLCVAVLLAGAGGAAAATDPFYERLLEEGSRRLEADPAGAARLLRIAAFGLLEDPPRLATALVRLSIAQSRARDGDSFRSTFERLLELEDRFGVLSGPGLSPADRAAFERAVPIHVPEERLLASPLFVDLAERRIELRLSQLPPRQQRRELEARAAERPGDVGRLMALARFETRQGREGRALEWLDRTLATDPEHEPARCLRGRLAADRNDCQRAAADLDRCSSVADNPGLAASSLRCLVREKRWPEASGLLGSLDPALRATPEIARLAARVPAPQPEQPFAAPGTEEAPGPSAGEPAASHVSPEPAPAETAPQAPPGPTLEERLAVVRGQIEAARSRDALSAALDDATRLADDNPDSREAQITAGEAAYRLSRWETAVRYFDRAGPRSGDRPLVVFYYSVALYESGRTEEAAGALRSVLPRLARTDFVQAYVDRILASGGPS